LKYKYKKFGPSKAKVIFQLMVNQGAAFSVDGTMEQPYFNIS